MGTFLLTHLSLGKMGAILHTMFSNAISWMIFFCVLIQIQLKFVPKAHINNKSVLVQVMAWRRIGDKPLPEPMLAQFTDAYMGHLGWGWDGGDGELKH